VQVNGEPMCTNKDLIGGTLREDFGFTGVLATDCGALRDATEHHHRYKDDKDTATAAIRAGVDSNCGSVFPRALPWAFGNGTMEPSDLDASVARLLAARFRLGLFDEGDASADVPLYNIEDVDDAANKAVALKAARQGVVLLQNGVAGAKAKLPLSKGIYKKVAMVGPNANATMNLLSGYHGSPPFLVSPLAAMRAKWGGESAVLYSVGCNVSDVDNKGNVTPAAVVQAAIDAATKTAVTADVTVLGLGASTYWPTLGWPALLRCCPVSPPTRHAGVARVQVFAATTTAEGRQRRIARATRLTKRRQPTAAASHCQARKWSSFARFTSLGNRLWSSL
jgi:beta-glucosidase-like glycosyl hydrolase